MKDLIQNIAAGALIVAVQAIGVYALLMPQPTAAGGYPPRTIHAPTTFIAFTHERQDCPADELRVYVAVDARKPHAFCWRLHGERVDLYDGSALISSLPVHGLDVETRSQQ